MSGFIRIFNVILHLLFLATNIFPQRGKVIGITDGDTMEMLIEGKTYKIRKAHIDAPRKNRLFGRKRNSIFQTCVMARLRL